MCVAIIAVKKEQSSSLWEVLTILNGCQGTLDMTHFSGFCYSSCASVQHWFSHWQPLSPGMESSSGLSSGLHIQWHHHYSRRWISPFYSYASAPHSMNANPIGFPSIISLHMSSSFHCHSFDTSLGFNSPASAKLLILTLVTRSNWHCFFYLLLTSIHVLYFSDGRDSNAHQIT